jgi:hypothetical protein
VLLVQHRQLHSPAADSPSYCHIPCLHSLRRKVMLWHCCCLECVVLASCPTVQMQTHQPMLKQLCVLPHCNSRRNQYVSCCTVLSICAACNLLQHSVHMCCCSLDVEGLVRPPAQKCTQTATQLLAEANLICHRLNASPTDAEAVAW